MTAQTILPANSASGGFEVANSARFDGAYHLVRSKGASETGLTKGTFSLWVKRTNIDGTQHMLYSNTVADSNNRGYFSWRADEKLRILTSTNNSSELVLESTQLFRDPSAWYHIVYSIDTTQSTAANRCILYINGTRVTAFDTATYMDQNSQCDIFEGGQTNKEYIGGMTGDTSNLHSYLSEYVYIDGLALAADQFGEFDEDSGIWKPIDVSGLTFGNEGFYLNFQTSAELGDDVSGNTNDFTESNLTAVHQSTDTCTNNFSTLNPLDVGDKDGRTLSNGNLDFTTSSGNNGHISGTLAVSGSGKWYFETKILAQSGTASSSAKFGIIGIRNINESSPGVAGNSYYVYSDGRKEDGDNTTNSAHPGYVLNDIVQVAFDLDGGNVYFGLNGDWGDNDGNFDEAFVDATAFFGSINTNGFWTIYLNKNVTADNVLTLSANFGSPSFAISSGNTDGNGYGNFEYAVPSGYFSLCTKNLAEYG